MHTEDEARTKFCCGGSAAHQQHDGMCKASSCMAWRWGTRQVIHNLKTGVVRDAEPGSRYSATDDVLQEVPSGMGYCGLAGKDGA